MTDQVNPGQAKSAPEVASDATTLQLLVQLLLAERQESLLERQEKARALGARNDQRRKNADYVVAENVRLESHSENS